MFMPLFVVGGEATVTPFLSSVNLSPETNTITLSSDVDCTVYWRRNATGDDPTKEVVRAGGGYDNGSFAVTATGSPHSEAITFATGNDGVQQICFTAQVGTGPLAEVVAGIITIETIAAAATRTYIGALALTDSGITHTWASAADVDGGYVIHLTALDEVITTVKVGGVNAAKLAGTFDGAHTGSTWFVPAGIAGNIIATTIGNSRIAGALYKVSGITSVGTVTKTNTGFDAGGPHSLTTDTAIPEGAICFGFRWRWGGGDGADTLSNGVTQDGTMVMGTGSRLSVGSSIKTGASTLTVDTMNATASGNDGLLIVALPKV